jgi:hypothetical protein
MAKKQNPYQLWLGLHPKLTNPNLFQLLGVDPRSQDEAAIKQKAIASAKMLLQRLKAVEPKSDAEKVFKQKLHAKIVLAHDTIIAPQKRKQYLNALLANSAAQKKITAPQYVGGAPRLAEFGREFRAQSYPGSNARYPNAYSAAFESRSR